MSAAGFAYSFANEDLLKFSHPVGLDEFSGSVKDVMQPLVFEPGEHWHYGVSMDFAGLLVEQVTGLSLNCYFHKHIFEPLGLENISMFPSADMKKRLAHMHQRKVDGSLYTRDHLLRKPLVVEQSEIKDVHNTGGAGCFSTPSDYGRTL